MHFPPVLPFRAQEQHSLLPQSPHAGDQERHFRNILVQPQAAHQSAEQDNVPPQQNAEPDRDSDADTPGDQPRQERKLPKADQHAEQQGGQRAEGENKGERRPGSAGHAQLAGVLSCVGAGEATIGAPGATCSTARPRSTWPFGCSTRTPSVPVKPDGSVSTVVV